VSVLKLRRDLPFSSSIRCLTSISQNSFRSILRQKNGQLLDIRVTNDFLKNIL